MYENRDAPPGMEPEDPAAVSELPPMSEEDKAAVCASIDAAFGVRREPNPVAVRLGEIIAPGVDAWFREHGNSGPDNLPG